MSFNGINVYEEFKLMPQKPLTQNTADAPKTAKTSLIIENKHMKFVISKTSPPSQHQLSMTENF